MQCKAPVKCKFLESKFEQKTKILYQATFSMKVRFKEVMGLVTKRTAAGTCWNYLKVYKNDKFVDPYCTTQVTKKKKRS